MARMRTINQVEGVEHRAFVRVNGSENLMEPNVFFKFAVLFASDKPSLKAWLIIAVYKAIYLTYRRCYA